MTQSYLVHTPCQMGSGGGRVVKLLACRARGPGSIPRLAIWISEIGYLLLPSRDMTEIPLKRRKSLIQPTNQSLSNVTMFYQYIPL